MPQSRDPAQRTVSRLEAYFGRRPDASAWIARPNHGVHFMVSDRKMTSGLHMSDVGIFVRPCIESRGWGIRSLSSRRLVVSRKAFVVQNPNTRHTQLALSDDLVGRNGSLDTSPGAYRASGRALLASHLDEALFAPPIADEQPTGVPVALVLALDADGARILVPESAWSSLDARSDIAK